MKPLRTLLTLLLAAVAAWSAPRPRLVVVLSVDQLPMDLVRRWEGEFSGGLGTLLREGTCFTSAYHEHGYTETGPGHASLLSGRHPARTGIPENRWMDRAKGSFVYCVEDPSTRNLDKERGPGSGPRWFVGSALPGWLLDQVPGSRAFSLSGKDRSGILMAGPRATGVFWFSEGGFTSSTAYAAALPSWLEAWNAEFRARIAESSLVWTPLRPLGDLVRAGRYELPGRVLVTGLPRAVKPLGYPLDKAFWERFRATPFFDQAILGAATRLIEAEGLGKGSGTDLLMLGLSATDYVGHLFGNGGPEMLDQLRRLDAELGGFLGALRREVPDAWVLLASDHGCTDFCERLQEQGFPARRVNQRAFLDRVEKALAERLQAKGPFLAATLAPQFWLRDEAVKASRKPREAVLAAALAVLRAQPELAGAWSGAELEALELPPHEAPEARSLPARLKLSYVPGRSGDILAALKPLVTFDDPPNVAAHGNPWDADRRVPLIFWGPWKAGRRAEPVRSVDLAPTLARELGLRPPEALDGRALELPPR